MPKQRTTEELKELQADSRKVLRLGALRESEPWLMQRIGKHGYTEESLRGILHESIAGWKDEEEAYDLAVDKLSGLLKGDHEAAEAFVIFDALDGLADQIFENLNAQAHMRRNGRSSGQAVHQLSDQLSDLRAQLVEMIGFNSCSSPFIVSTVVDGYISSISNELGLTGPGQLR